MGECPLLQEEWASAVRLADLKLAEQRDRVAGYSKMPAREVPGLRLGDEDGYRLQPTNHSSI